jgi:hypothetical protein
MNRSPDVELVLRDYFADDSWTAPDHVLDLVEERITRQPQQRSWRLLWRLPMNTPIKLAAAVGAVLVVAVAGFAMFGRPSDSNVGGAASPTPSPSPIASASPSAVPSAAAVFPPWYTEPSDGAGILPAGEGTTRAFRPSFTFSVPAGWVNDIDNEVYRLFQDTPANEAQFGLAGGPAQNIFMGGVDSPGVICDGIGAQGSTASELADSLVTNEALVTSEPVEVTIGGLTGTRVDAHIDPDWTGTCQAYGSEAEADPKDYRGRFVFLDVPDGGKLLIIVDSVHAADFEAFLADAMPVVESFEFDVSN